MNIIEIIEDDEVYSVYYKDNGSILWHKKDTDILHRKNGPAIENDDFKKWYYNGKLHRTNGPAVESSFCKRWYLNGKLHREDGPAKLDSDGSRNYYVNGRFMNVNSDEELMIKILLE